MLPWNLRGQNAQFPILLTGLSAKSGELNAPTGSELPPTALVTVDHRNFYNLHGMVQLAMFLGSLAGRQLDSSVQ
jgi:hypothetical protein